MTVRGLHVSVECPNCAGGGELHAVVVGRPGRTMSSTILRCNRCAVEWHVCCTLRRATNSVEPAGPKIAAVDPAQLEAVS